MSHTEYQQYNLESVPFDEESFMQNTGGRLITAGLADIAMDMAAVGAERAFLHMPVEARRMREINSTAALDIAREAGVFAARASEVTIIESGEPMAHLPTRAGNAGHYWFFSDAPFHPACGEWAGKPRQFWARRGLVDALSETSRMLAKADLGLRFEDAFRPEGVQEGLFARRYRMALDEHPEWTPSQAILEAKSKTAFSARLASHKGAAAVDVRTVDLRTGTLLDIGHSYPDGGAHVALDSPFVTQKQWENRMVLAMAAARQGMDFFPFEDWHACIGDNTAAACAPAGENPIAVYGPVKSFDERSGAITAIYSGAELDKVFDVRA